MEAEESLDTAEGPSKQPVKQPALVIFGGNSSFNYLIQRYAARIGYTLTVTPSASSAESICRLSPEAVIFPSIASLEEAQLLTAGLVDCDIPIIVCSSTADQIRARQLGADYCLLHPLVYDNFSLVLGAIRAQKAQTDANIPLNPGL